MTSTTDENNYPTAIIIATLLMGAFIAISFIWAIGTFQPPENLGMGGMVVNYGSAEVGMGDNYISVEEPSVAENANNKAPDKVNVEQVVTKTTTSQTSDKNIVTQNTEEAVSVTTSSKKNTATPTSAKESKPAEQTINQNALYKGKKNNGIGAGDGTGDIPGNQGSANGDPLAPYYGDGGSGNGSKPLPLDRFSNLVPLKDDSQKTGKIFVKIQVNKQGRVISATAGVKGTTFSDNDLFRKCERTLLAASLNAIESGPEIRIFYVPFIFKVD